MRQRWKVLPLAWVHQVPRVKGRGLVEEPLRKRPQVLFSALAVRSYFSPVNVLQQAVKQSGLVGSSPVCMTLWSHQ